MTKKSKLEQHGLLDEARKLKDTGMSDNAVANHIMQRHPEVKISLMAVRRGLAILEEKKIDEQIQEGLNPADELDELLRKKIEESDRKLLKLEERANKALDRAEGGDSIADITKALKESRETNAQIIKNQIALKQYYGKQIEGINKKAFEQKEQVNILLNQWIMKIESGLCPKCKQEIIPEVIKLIQLEKEEKE